MNRYTLIGALCFLLGMGQLHAQAPVKDNRTTETRIADLLAQLPATDQNYLVTLMKSMADLGEDGLVKTASMLVPTGKGNDAAVRFAIGGFSKFVTLPGQESNRILCEKAWGRAIEASSEPEVKAFLLNQLWQAGTDLSVPVAATYLTDQTLSDPACRALANINTPAAGEALLAALPGATGNAQLSIIEALGDIGYQKAATAIAPLCSSADGKLKKTALYALSRTGQAEAGPVLLDAASKSGFTGDASDATASYVYWLNRQVKDNPALAAKHSKNLVKTCIAPAQVHTRSAALKLLVAASGEKAGATVLQAVQSDNMKYRDAALSLAPQLKGSQWTAAWVKAASKATPAAKADILTMLGDRGDPAAVPALQQGLSDPDQGIRKAAISSYASLAPAQALPDLLGLMKKGTADDIQSITTQLLTMKGDALLPAISGSLADMPSAAKSALIGVLAARRNSASLPEIYRETLSSDAGVRLSAFKALQELVSSNDLDALANLLAATRTGEETAAVQSALIAAANTLPEKERTPAVLRQMKASGAGAAPLYYPVLAGIGDNPSLNAVVADFNSGNGTRKQDAFKALTGWTGPAAIHPLLKIAAAPENTDFKGAAVRAVIGQIKRSGYPDDQRLLLLREAMKLAPGTPEKSMILKEMASCHTYPAFKFAAQYLDDPQMQQDAASTAATIALASPELFGEDIRDVLTRVIGMITGNEADYRKEAIRKHLAAMPSGTGFVPLFNGKDLTGWKGLVENPIVRAKMTPKELAKAQAKADEIMRTGWKVENGELVFTGKGENLCTVKQYGDFEMFVDWKIQPDGDAGIYLRGSPQVQIWDTTRHDVGAQVGSGGLYNNEINERIPLTVADNLVGEWNTFRILMQGERVTVYLNGKLVVNNVILENYWDRKIPIFPLEQLELQAHGTLVAYRDIWVREIPRPEPYHVSEQEKAEGFTELFDGISMFNFTGNTTDYVVEDGTLAVYPKYGGHGNLYTKSEYSDFVFRFEFQLTPGANNGIGIRTPLEGDAAYVGMEIQVLDNTADIYRNLQPYQYHGSVYGVIPAKREYLKPLGEWNEEEIFVQGTHIRVTLNGTVIVDGDIAEASKNGTLDHKDHPGLLNPKGHIGFLGHGSDLKFRNIRIKELK